MIRHWTLSAPNVSCACLEFRTFEGPSWHVRFLASPLGEVIIWFRTHLNVKNPIPAMPTIIMLPRLPATMPTSDCDDSWASMRTTVTGPVQIWNTKLVTDRIPATSPTTLPTTYRPHNRRYQAHTDHVSTSSASTLLPFCKPVKDSRTTHRLTNCDLKHCFV